MLEYAADDPPANQIEVLSLGQLVRDGTWRIELAHDRPDHLFVWITRGQGIGLIDGARRGLGLHNAVFIPARHLFALDLGRQVFGQAVIIPPGAVPTLPDTVQHLRLRDTAAQAELTGLFDAIGREQSAARPHHDQAIGALVHLIAIWLRRQMDNTPPAPRTPKAQALTRAYGARLVTHFASGASLAEHASFLNVTPTHLTRVCKSEIGKTAGALLTERQLHAARRMLADTNRSAKDIAQHLGFGSAAYFSRFIQYHTGSTPTGLRRRSKTTQVSG